MSKKLTGKVEYITLNQMFDIIKDEVKGKCRKGTKFPQKEDGGLKEKYSLALNMWQHWYEEYTKELKKNKKLQEQLKYAETALRFYDSKDFHYEVDGVVMGAEPAHKYFVKWGVK